MKLIIYLTRPTRDAGGNLTFAFPLPPFLCLWPFAFPLRGKSKGKGQKQRLSQKQKQSIRL